MFRIRFYFVAINFSEFNIIFVCLDMKFKLRIS
jgi:hypothetical protein